VARYKIGITEAGDAGLDLSWADKLDTVDGAIVITKCVTPDFYDAALSNKGKLIIHTTFTGYGHSVLEPNVPSPYDEFDAIMALERAGFPKEKIVIRIDPIIPTPKGIATAKNVFKTFMDVGFSRFRVSIIDMYPHVRERFIDAGLPLPYDGRGFYPSVEQVQAVDKMFEDVKEYWFSIGRRMLFGDVLRIESCAEPGLKNACRCGCISEYDLNLLGLTEKEPDSFGYQRPNCLCYSGKTELLKHKERCPNGCLYCYWK